LTAPSRWKSARNPWVRKYSAARIALTALREGYSLGFSPGLQNDARLFGVAVTAASGPYLHVQSMIIDDDGNGASSGDGDGQADAGETIELTVILKNGGGTQATGLSAVLTAEDPANALTIVQGTVNYGTLAPGGSSGGSGAYVIAIAPEAEVAYQPVETRSDFVFVTLGRTGDCRKYRWFW